MGAAAVAAGKAIGYVGAGTVEFIVDADGDFYFLEVNTRLQVEHPVTEAVTGLDLVRLQILVAAGRAAARAARTTCAIDGHAVEARLYAEDPRDDFLPATGRIALWEPPELPGVRCDSGVEAGSEVSVHYDPLLAKVIAHGPTRGRGDCTGWCAPLARLGVAGVTTNRELPAGRARAPGVRARASSTRTSSSATCRRRRAAHPSTPRFGAPARRRRALHDHARAPRCRRAAAAEHPVGLAQQPLAAAGRLASTGDGDAVEVGYVARRGRPLRPRDRRREIRTRGSPARDADGHRPRARRRAAALRNRA